LNRHWGNRQRYAVDRQNTRGAAFVLLLQQQILLSALLVVVDRPIQSLYRQIPSISKSP
jgi:hypothetical protein